MVTPYALSNYQKNKHYVEAWAETFVLRRYQLQVGALPGSAAKVACVQKQLNVMAKQTDAQIQAGYNAAKRVQPGKIIKRANVKRSLAEGNGGLDRRSELEEEDDGKMEYFDEVGEYRVYEPIERQSPQEDAAEEAEEEEHGHDHYDVYPAHFDGNYTLFEPEE